MPDQEPDTPAPDTGDTNQRAREQIEEKIAERKRTARKLRLAVGGGVLLLLLIAGAIWYFRSRSTSEEVIRERTRTLISEVKAAEDHSAWVGMVTPAARRPIQRAVNDLGVPLDDILKNTAFPYDLMDLAVAPDKEDILVNRKGPLARVYFTDQDDSYQIYLARDGGKWWIYLQTPVEKQRYGAVEQQFDFD